MISTLGDVRNSWSLEEFNNASVRSARWCEEDLSEAWGRRTVERLRAWLGSRPESEYQDARHHDQGRAEGGGHVAGARVLYADLWSGRVLLAVHLEHNTI